MALLDFFSHGKRTPPTLQKNACKSSLQNGAVEIVNRIIYRS